MFPQFKSINLKNIKVDLSYLLLFGYRFVLIICLKALIKNKRTLAKMLKTGNCPKFILWIFSHTQREGYVCFIFSFFAKEKTRTSLKIS